MELSKKAIVTIVVIVAVILAAVGYIAHLNGNSLDFSDTDVKIVVSSSMDGEPRTEYEIQTIPTGSMIFIHKVTDDSFYSSLKVGDVLTFNYLHPTERTNMVVTHRIVAISESGGVYTYTLSGDAIEDDPTNSSTQTVTSDSGDVIGKVVGVSHALGALTVFVSGWEGKVVLILIPCAILIVSEVVNIVKILRKKEQPEAVPDVGADAPVDGSADPAADAEPAETLGDGKPTEKEAENEGK